MAFSIEMYQTVKTVAMANSVGQRIMLKSIDQAVETLAMTNSAGQRVMLKSVDRAVKPVAMANVLIFHKKFFK